MDAASLALATIGLFAVRIGWGLPIPDGRGQPTPSQGVGLLVMLALFALGIWLLVLGLA